MDMNKSNEYEQVQQNEMIEKARKIAWDAHSGQVDKTGWPYINHALRVSEMKIIDSPEKRIVALLHDVIEDTDVTYDDLREHGFSGEIINSVRLVTKTKDTKIDEYFYNIKGDPVARAVKIADLTHNMDKSRWDEPGAGWKDLSDKERKKRLEWFKEKRKEYRKWRDYLSQE
jgi:(p)ppGpp synthase/HD superfamily hydrolase